MEDTERMIEQLRLVLSGEAAANDVLAVPEALGRITSETAGRVVELSRKILESDEGRERPILSAVVSCILAEATLSRAGAVADEELEEAIAACQRCLEVWDAESAPLECAKARGLLGLCYSVRRHGGREENGERAREHFLAALDVLAPEHDRLMWAKICHNLGSVYTRRRAGDRAANAELAIRYCEMALDVFKQDDGPVRWGVMQSDLGLAYISSESREDNERAIAHLSEAVAVFSEHRSEPQAARFLGHAQQRLGLAYRCRQSSDQCNKDAFRKIAISHFEKAVAIFAELSASADRAMAQYELAKEYLKSGNGNAPADTERAIQLLEESLEDSSASKDAMRRANLRFTLARALCRRDSAHSECDLREAIRHYRESLQVFRRNPSSVKSSIAERELALAEARLASTKTGE